MSKQPLIIRFLFVVIASGLLLNCESPDRAQSIIDKAIEAHGGDRFEHSNIEFDFRGRHYTAYRMNGKFIYTREFYTDSIGHVKDILANDGFQRMVNGSKADITEERAGAYTNSVNGVLYFALLPFRLNDPSAVKTFDGESELNGQAYYRIRVTFDPDKLKEDNEDIFLYWINKKSYHLDFFAYSYTSEGGGVRFREATDAQNVNGIVVQDYINYKPQDETLPVEEMEALYRVNKLERLSIIDHENLSIEILEKE